MARARKTFDTAVTEQNVWELTLARTRVVFDRFDHVVVSFSGGKDSTVCLNAALTVARERDALPVDVVHWDEEAIPPETVDYVRRVYNSDEVAMRWFAHPIKHRNACSTEQPWWHPWNPDKRELWCRPLPPEALHDPSFPRVTIPEAKKLVFARDLGRVGLIMGIRADESLRRRRAVTTKVRDNWISVWPDAKHVYVCKTIYDWRTDDVWAAPHVFGWDYNRTYDTLSRLGITPHAQRVAPPFGEEPFQRLWQYAQCWPALWEAMLRRVDGAAAAGRYSQSALYGFGKLFLDTDEEWPVKIREVLMRWAPTERRGIAERIEREIRAHNADTNNAPLKPRSTDGSLDWVTLYRIAVRGDLKGRRGRKLGTDVSQLGAAGSGALKR